MKKILIILILFISNFCYADVFNNPSKIENIINKLPELKSIKCKFKQEKTVSKNLKPLISGGDFEFIENKGVYFYTKYPYEVKTDYTAKNYKQINEIIKAISKKQYSSLEKEFYFYFEGDETNWILGLKPKKTSKSNNVLSSITIKGDKSKINEIKISQKNGCRTSIWLQK